MKPHKWAKEIKAWADGAEIECKVSGCSEWTDVTAHSPSWYEDNEYRIKPQPKDLPDCVKTWLSMGATMEQIEKAVVDEIDKQFPKPKEPQYLYVYRDTIDENGNSTTLVKISTVKINIDRYIGKIPLITETDDGA